MKHTLGPWKVVYDGDGSVNSIRTIDFHNSMMGDYRGCIIADLTLAHGGRKLAFSEAEANAQLIAAAPDMYEALSEIDKLNILDHLLDYADSDTEAEDYHYAMRCVQAALAKARSEQ